jgi:hypothetical protein
LRSCYRVEHAACQTCVAVRASALILKVITMQDASCPHGNHIILTLINIIDNTSTSDIHHQIVCRDYDFVFVFLWITGAFASLEKSPVMGFPCCRVHVDSAKTIIQRGSGKLLLSSFEVIKSYTPRRKICVTSIH